MNVNLLHKCFNESVPVQEDCCVCDKSGLSEEGGAESQQQEAGCTVILSLQTLGTRHHKNRLNAAGLHLSLSLHQLKDQLPRQDVRGQVSKAQGQV